MRFGKKNYFYVSNDMFYILIFLGMGKMSFLFLLFSFFFSENGGVKIEKQLLYDRHTLEDNYEYRKVERSFQWDKIAGMIDNRYLFG